MLADADVIVVGGGPAGAMAAYQLAGQASVMVLERRRLPREKTCSGLLSAKSMRLLSQLIDLRPVLCGGFNETRIGKGGMSARHRHAPMWIADRSQMDFALLAAAARRGARVEEEARVRRVWPEDGIVELTSGQRLRARAIVGADGATGVTSRALNGELPHHAVAMEARIHDPRPVADRPAIIDFAVPRGYFWAFPHGREVLAVGGGSADPRVFAQLRASLAGWVQQRIGSTGAQPLWHAYFVPFSGVRRLVAGRTLLAGDAGGLADPLLGEGIAYALWSGALAAEVCARHLRGQVELSSYAGVVRGNISAFQKPLRLVSQLPGAGTLIALAVQPLSLRRLGWRKVVERCPQEFGFDLQSLWADDPGIGALDVGSPADRVG